ncbi:Nn.00g007260.m01.CDS01 [Neocucurbitaria sp. VM-36]
MGVKRSHRDSVSSSEDSSTPYLCEQSVDSKIAHVDADSAISDQAAVMRCSLPPHEPLSFTSFEDYDVHYQKTHMNRCSECHKNFPDEHLLLLHIAEYHDPIVAGKRDQGEKTAGVGTRYACLVPSCDRLCSTPQKRRLHCIDKHHFPRNYDFIIVKDGIDRRSSMLIPPHRRRSSAFSSAGGNVAAAGRRRGESSASTVPESMDVVRDQSDDQDDVDEEEEKDSESRRYPTKLHGRGGFSHARGTGRGRGRGFSTATHPSKPAPAPAASIADPMEKLTSRHTHSQRPAIIQSSTNHGTSRNVTVGKAMEYIARLHYAYRSLLLLFDHLKSSKLVKTECALVCCHVVELRVIFTTLQQPPNHCLHAVTLRVRIPTALAALAAIMKPLTITRCTIANEILRRRKQMECDNTHRPHLPSEQRTDLISISFEDTPAAKTHRKQGDKPSAALTEEPEPLAADEEHSVDPTSLHGSAPNGNNTPSAQHRGSSTWELHAKQRNSAIFAALQRKIEARARKQLFLQSATDMQSKESIQNMSPSAPKDHQRTMVTPQRRVHQPDERDTLDGAYRFPPDQGNIANHSEYVANSESNLPQSCQELSRGSTSPASDTTLYEVPIIYSLSQLKGGEGHQPNVPFDETEKHVKIDEDLSTPVPKRHEQRQRRLSTDSASGLARTPKIPLRARAKTNDGMLQFRASPAKEPTKSAPARRHRHKISLNIPVVTSVQPFDGFQDSTLRAAKTDSPRRLRTRDIQVPNTLTLAERELEYKHRRTFIGTASLDDLLELLEVTPEHTTTKDAIAKAFIALSSTEQLYARQCSRRSDGWALVSRVTPDVTDIDYVAQLQVKLGSITLRQFLNLILFSDEEEVEALHVVEAFSAASHMDVMAGVGTGSKARAFRSWMVSQEDIGC